ncbi:MAG: hypothetical protein MI757_01355 [Pirellulales bacterium]|nr:hypothetical protein [Pirellulales bacterium]
MNECKIPKGVITMWRACFLAMGTFCFILGAQALVVEKVVMASEGTQASAAEVPGEVPPAPREYKPHEAAPWMLMSVGAVVMLYSFTIPRRVRD